MLLCAVLGMANYYKLIYRLEPILVTDVTQIREALETMGGMDFHFDMGKLWTWVIGTAVLMAAAILLLKQKRERRWLALPLAGLMLAFVCVTVFGSEFNPVYLLELLGPVLVLIAGIGVLRAGPEEAMPTLKR